MIHYLKNASHPATLLWMTLAALFCWSQSPLAFSVLVAVVGAMAGTVVAFLVQDVRAAVWRVFLLTSVAIVAVNVSTDLARWMSLPSYILGSSLAYRLSDAFFWGGEALLVVFLLRWLSYRKPSLVGVELLVAGGLLVNLFAAHRDGFLNRPYELVDPLWSRGIDPMPVFLAFGVLVGGLLLVLAATHSNKRGRWLDVAILLMVLGGLFLFAPLDKIKDFPVSPELAMGKDSDPYSTASGGADSQADSNSDNTGIGGGGTSSNEQSGGQEQQSTGQSGGQGRQPADQNGGQGQQSTGQSDAQGQQPTGQNGSPGEQPPGEDGEQQSGGSENPHDKSPNSGQGGNSDEPSFSDAQSPRSNNPAVAVVIFRDDYTPDTGMYYLRQEAFSEYNGTKMVSEPSGRFDRDTALEFPGAEPERAKVPYLDGKLFRKLDTRVALIKDHAKPFGLANPTEWRAVTNPDPKRFQRAYDVSSLVLDRPIAEILGHPAGDPSWTKEQWEHYTEGPADPRYAELFRKIAAAYPEAPQDDPLIRALMVKLWLEENGVYSLKSKHANSSDPTADFLFGDRTGYCVYFAHAAVYLYRTAGMPARIGSGYAVEVSQRGSGSSLLIPGSSAHAWPEVYLHGLGWVVLDISPQRSLDPPPDSVDQGLQQMLGEMARQDPGQQPPDPAEEKIDLQEMAKEAAQAAAAGFPWLLLAALAGAYSYKLYRRFLPRYCRPERYPDAAFRSILDTLCDAGFVRAPGEPRAAFARRVAEVSPAFHELTSYHLRLRLGDPSKVPVYPWKETFEQARQEIRNSLTVERIWKGFLNPISWIKVH